MQSGLKHEDIYLTLHLASLKSEHFSLLTTSDLFPARFFILIHHPPSASFAHTKGEIPTSSMSSNEEGKAMLVGMGFDPEAASQALRECGGNLEQAANLLLTGGGGNSSIPNSNTGQGGGDSMTVRMIHSPLSQYSVENGRSACTCIALTAAENFLRKAAVGDTNVTPNFLQEAITNGVQTYNSLNIAQQSQSMEHMAAEDVLRTGAFGLAVDEGGMQQGMLTMVGLNLRALLPAGQSPTHWTCALVTKPPETVVCCIPPASQSSSSASFLLVDSHPRQAQFQAEGAYVRSHDSMEGLIRSLDTLFPPTDLGDDIPEMMAAMYNSFDLYRLHLRDESGS
jgi:hypothetical protein